MSSLLAKLLGISLKEKILTDYADSKVENSLKTNEENMVYQADGLGWATDFGFKCTSDMSFEYKRFGCERDRF